MLHADDAKMAFPQLVVWRFSSGPRLHCCRLERPTPIVDFLEPVSVVVVLRPITTVPAACMCCRQVTVYNLIIDYLCC